MATPTSTHSNPDGGEVQTTAGIIGGGLSGLDATQAQQLYPIRGTCLDVPFSLGSFLDLVEKKERVLLSAAIAGRLGPYRAGISNALERSNTAERYAVVQKVLRRLCSDRKLGRVEDEYSDYFRSAGDNQDDCLRLVWCHEVANLFLGLEQTSLRYLAVKAYNRAIAHHCGPHRGLLACGIVSLAIPAVASMEIERGARLGIRAWIFDLNEFDAGRLGSDALDGVWLALSRAATPFAIGPVVLPPIDGDTVGDRESSALPRVPMDARNYSLANSLRAFEALSESRRFERFPRLRLFILRSDMVGLLG